MLWLVFYKGAGGGGREMPLLWPLQNFFSNYFWQAWLISSSSVRSLPTCHRVKARLPLQLDPLPPLSISWQPQLQEMPWSRPPEKSISPAGALSCRNLGQFCHLLQHGFCRTSLVAWDLPPTCCSLWLCFYPCSASCWWLRCHVPPSRPWMSPAAGEVRTAPHHPHTGSTGGTTPPWSRADHPCFSEELVTSVLGYNPTHLPSSGGLVALWKLFQETELT